MKKNRIFKLIVVVMLLALTAGMIWCVVKVTNGSDSKALNALDYRIGKIDQDGEYVHDTAYLVTKDYVSLSGLSVELQKNADVQVRVMLFDKDHNLVSGANWTLEPSKDDKVTWAYADYKSGYESADPKPTCAMVEIAPLHDSEVSWTEIAGYVKQVAVTYSK